MRLAFAPSALAALAPFAALALAPACDAQTLDRYGGGAAAPASGAAPASPYAPAPYTSASAGYAAPAYPGMAVYGRGPSGPAQAAPGGGARAGLRTLSWPGKDPAPSRQPSPSMAADRPAGAYAMAPSPYPATPMTQPTPYPPAPRYGFVQPRATVRPLPTSIYRDGPAPLPPTAAMRPPAPAPQGYGAAPPYPAQPYAYGPAAAAVAQGSAAPATAALAGGSRQYSVHRDYGLTPDPAPIPPQFFANTADLSSPETPEAPIAPRVTGNATTAKATENAARLAASATP